jgi:nucleolin
MLSYCVDFDFRFAYLEFGDMKKVKKYIETKQGVEVEGQELFLDVANKKTPNDRRQRGGFGGGRGGDRGGRGRGGGGGRGGRSGKDQYQ